MRLVDDTSGDQRLRRRLVNSLEDKGITDDRVLKAIYQIPRHYFMPIELQDMAYEDRPYPIGEGQTISQPYTVAYQTQLLDLQVTDRVLEIGSGSAYQAVILALLASEVFTIERQKKLFDKYSKFEYLKEFQNLHFFYGDGYEGLPQYAPFDKILITAAAPRVPTKLVEQLKHNGTIVLPLGEGKLQRMVRITKNGEGETKEEMFDNFSFVPMLAGKKE